MAGAGYKLFNTGDVLTAAQVNTYLQEQTVMVFASAAARTSALSGVLAEGMISYLKDTNAVEKYDGSAWSAIGTGDIEGVTAGTGLTGGGTSGTVTLNFDVANYGGGSYAAGKNKIINGDFTINQRGFSSSSSDGYGFDRWKLGLSGGTATYSLQTFTLGSAPVAGYEAKNFARIAVTTGNDYCRLEQDIESVRTFAGQTVTLSFWAKGTNPTTAGNLKANLAQFFGSGGTPSATIILQQTFVLTGSWTRYSLTFNVPSISGKTIGTDNNDYLAVWFGQGDSTSTESYTLDIWGVQLEAGSTATAFQTATGTLAGELAACQRYLPAIPLASGQSAYMGYAYATNGIVYSIPFPTQARVSPTGITIPALSNFAATNSSNTAITPTALTFDSANLNSATVLATATATAGTPNRLTFYANAAYMLFTGCEL